MSVVLQTGIEMISNEFRQYTEYKRNYDVLLSLPLVKKLLKENKKLRRMNKRLTRMVVSMSESSITTPVVRTCEKKKKEMQTVVVKQEVEHNNDDEVEIIETVEKEIVPINLMEEFNDVASDTMVVKEESKPNIVYELVDKTIEEEEEEEEGEEEKKFKTPSPNWIILATAFP
jgi:hypothetical protein